MKKIKQKDKKELLFETSETLNHSPDSPSTPTAKVCSTFPLARIWQRLASIHGGIVLDYAYIDVIAFHVVYEANMDVSSCIFV